MHDLDFLFSVGDGFLLNANFLQKICIIEQLVTVVILEGTSGTNETPSGSGGFAIGTVPKMVLGESLFTSGTFLKVRIGFCLHSLES